MKRIYFTLLFFYLFTAFLFGQYNFPACYTTYVTGTVYLQGQKVSKEGKNYEAKYWTNTTPPGVDWELLGPCGNADIALGPNYQYTKRIIGYLPTWNTTYNYNDYDPSKVTNVVISFLEIKTNNNNYNSDDFASIQFKPQTISDVENVLVNKNVLQRSHNVNTKVSVAVGGAIDYGFLWLMEKYYNDDVKLQEIAQLFVDFANTHNIDGIDLDMECWWSDPAISGTTEQGGRVRGDKWGGPDQGPHPAGIGLKKLAQKIKTIQPNLLLSSAVFGTSWYGNNYDDTMHQYLDWIGLMTYDFTGSWNASPKGPHTALYKLPLSTYEGQTLDNPVYSVEDALEYWQGIANATWNHDGGFNVPRAKLCIGSPFYGYDFSTLKPGGNGYVTLTYKEIVTNYPSAPTSYDPLNPQNFSGYISEGGKRIYYETPMSIKKKYQYIQDFGQQGIIIWELTNDLHPSNPNSLLYSLNQQINLANESFESTKNIVFFHDGLLQLLINDYVKNAIVYDVNGRQIKELQINNICEPCKIPLTLSKGIFYVKVNGFIYKIVN